VINESKTGVLEYYLQGRVFDPYTPMVIMYTKNDLFYPLFFDQSSISHSNTSFHWRMYYHFIQPSITRFRFGLRHTGGESDGDAIDMSSKDFTRMSVKELQYVFNQRNLDIREVSPITGKRVYKKKQTLIHELV
jgi:hypothetical protein